MVTHIRLPFWRVEYREKNSNKWNETPRLFAKEEADKFFDDFRLDYRILPHEPIYADVKIEQYIEWIK